MLTYVTLLCMGMMSVAAVLNALTSYLLTRAQIFDAQRAAVWLTGSLNGRSWDHVVPVAAALGQDGRRVLRGRAVPEHGNVRPLRRLGSVPAGGGGGVSGRRRQRRADRRPRRRGGSQMSRPSTRPRPVQPTPSAST